MGCYQQHTDSQLVHWCPSHPTPTGRRFCLLVDGRVQRVHRLFRSQGALPLFRAAHLLSWSTRRLEPSALVGGTRPLSLLENCIANTSIFVISKLRRANGGCLG